MDSEKPNIVGYTRGRFAAQLPADYLYTASHFWLARQADEIWRVGLTKFATRMVGELVDHGFGIEPGAAVTLGQAIGWVEGFKAVADLYSVADGQFAGGNPALEGDIALVNKDPQGAGWVYAVKGQPDPQCVGVEGYVKILDRAIDRLLEQRAGA